MISREEHRRLQELYLGVLKDYHSFCVSNNLRYYLIAGSALGAKRHAGFIPWDVDIDVAMPREDYEKFDELCRSGALSDSYEYSSYKNNKSHYLSHALLLIPDSEIVFREDGRRTQLFLDIAPLDNMPNDIMAAQKNFNKVKRITWLISGKQNMQHLGQGKAKRLLKKIAQILLMPVPLSTLNRLRDDAMSKYRNVECDYYVNYAGKYSMIKDSAHKSVFGAPTLMKFEDGLFFAPERINEYLTRMYGEYEILPSDDEQERLWNGVDSVRFPGEQHVMKGAK